jgi:hypothetical protein
MTLPKPVLVEPVKIFPDCVYRTTLSYALFGYGAEQTRKKIRTGELPPPFQSTPTAGFEVWTGQQILDVRAEQQKAAALKLEAARKNPPQQKAAFAAVKDKPRIRKLKLRPPVAKARQRESA